MAGPSCRLPEAFRRGYCQVRPIEIARFGRFAPDVGLRRHPSSAQEQKGRRPTIGLRPKRVTSVTAYRAGCRPAPTPFIGAGAERSAKADHWPVAQKGDFSHRLSRPVSACADTLYRRRGAERSAKADHWPQAQPLFSRLKSPALGASHLVSV